MAHSCGFGQQTRLEIGGKFFVFTNENLNRKLIFYQFSIRYPGPSSSFQPWKKQNCYKKYFHLWRGIIPPPPRGALTPMCKSTIVIFQNIVCLFCSCRGELHPATDRTYILGFDWSGQNRHWTTEHIKILIFHISSQNRKFPWNFALF